MLIKKHSRFYFAVIFTIATISVVYTQQKIGLPEDKPAEIASPVIPTDATMYKYYPSRSLHKSTTPYHIPVSTRSSDTIENATFIDKGKKIKFQQYLKKTETLAFLIIKDDSIRYEKYFSSKGIVCDSNSTFTSFSIAKSFVSALFGTALNEGKIKSLDSPVSEYVSGLPVNKGFEYIKVKHLLQMTSGIKFNEEKGLSSDLSNLYQVIDIRAYLQHLQMLTVPGTQFEYKSIDTQLLALLLTSATGTSLTAYLQKKLWEPMGMEHDASWSLDKMGGVERAYSCINAQLKDFAKFGLLDLHKGKLNGKQIVPESWVNACTQAELKDGGSPFYKNQWWLIGGLLGDKQTDFAAIGIMGQYIYINPTKNVVMAKFSNKATDYKADYLALRAMLGYL